MLKKNLNFFYDFLQGGIIKPITTHLGDGFYDDEELGQYKNVYKDKNKTEKEDIIYNEADDNTIDLKDFEDFYKYETRNKRPNKKKLEFEVPSEFLYKQAKKDLSKTVRDTDLGQQYSQIGERNLNKILNDLNEGHAKYKQYEHYTANKYAEFDYYIIGENNQKYGIAEVKQVKYNSDELPERAFGLNKMGIIDETNKTFEPDNYYEGFYIFRNGDVEKISSNHIVKFGGRKMTFKNATQLIADIMLKEDINNPLYSEASRILEKKILNRRDQNNPNVSPKWWFSIPTDWFSTVYLKKKERDILRPDIFLSNPDDIKFFNDLRNKQPHEEKVKQNFKDEITFRKFRPDNVRHLLKKNIDSKIKTIDKDIKKLKNLKDEAEENYFLAELEQGRLRDIDEDDEAQEVFKKKMLPISKYLTKIKREIDSLEKSKKYV